MEYLNWDLVRKRLRDLWRGHVFDGWITHEELIGCVIPLQIRFQNGERTRALYEAVMKFKDEDDQ